MTVVYCLFLLMFYSMVDHQQQNVEAAEVTNLVVTSLVEDFSFIPTKKYSGVIDTLRVEAKEKFNAEFKTFKKSANFSASKY